MFQRFKDYVKGYLSAFDSIDLNSRYTRRMAVKPLYDFFQLLLLEVGVNLCSLDRNSLRNCFLKIRWSKIRGAIALIEDPAGWDPTLNALNNLRSKVEHNDGAVPSKQALLSIRRKAPEFMDWILFVGDKYYKESKGFSFLQQLSLLSSWYVGETERILSLYGAKPPYSAKGDFVPIGEKHPYFELKQLRDNLQSGIMDVKDVNDLSKEDLITLVELIKQVERLNAKEAILLQYSICPKCGSKIVESENYVGGSPEDPTPSAILYRVGCEKCDYELNSETIEV